MSSTTSPQTTQFALTSLLQGSRINLMNGNEASIENSKGGTLALEHAVFQTLQAQGLIASDAAASTDGIEVFTISESAVNTYKREMRNDYVGSPQFIIGLNEDQCEIFLNEAGYQLKMGHNNASKFVCQDQTPNGDPNRWANHRRHKRPVTSQANNVTGSMRSMAFEVWHRLTDADRTTVVNRYIDRTITAAPARA